jgi:hypothetical protein
MEIIDALISTIRLPPLVSLELACMAVFLSSLLS